MIRNHNLLSGVASAVGPFSRGRLWAAHGAYGGFSLASLFAASEQGVWYDPSDKANLDWRRNLLTYTEDFGNAAWSKIRATVTANAAIAPDGTLTADKCITNEATFDGAVNQTVAYSAGQYTASIYAKKAERDYLFIRERSSGSVRDTYFNLATGTTGIVHAAHTATITDVGSGWYRCSITFTATAVSNALEFYNSADDGNTNSASATDGIFLWGAQLEAGSTATAYQKITDVFTETRERFPNATLFQDSAGTQPAASAGDVVGLMLDKSQGLVRGPELVTNGGFATDTTDWTSASSATLTSTGGRLRVTSGGTPGYARYNLTGLTVGRSYELTADLFTGTVSPVLFVGTSAGGSQYGSRATSGAIIFTATNATAYLSAWANSATSGVYAEYDNISVREIPGNHATQATTASKPILARHPVGGRRNLLTYTEDFGNGVWAKQNVTAAGDIVSYNGAATATTAFCQRELPIDGGTASKTFTVSAVLSGTGKVRLKNTHGNVKDNFSADITLTATPTEYQISVTNGASAGSGAQIAGIIPATDNSAFTVSAKLQLETGATATAYQKVVSQYNVTEAGKADLWYLAFDGFDDGMATGSINFTSTDEMTVIAGVRKLSDAATGTVVELSANAGSNNGSFLVRAPGGGGVTDFFWLSRGTTVGQVFPTGYAAPSTKVLSGVGKVSTDTCTLRLDGSQVDTSVADQGTGNYGNYPLYIGRRGGSSLPLNGHLYGLVVRGALTAGDTLTKAEEAVSQKTYGDALFGVPPAGAGISYVGGKVATVAGTANPNVSLTSLTGGSDSAAQEGDIVVVGYLQGNISTNVDIQTVSPGWTEVADLYANDSVDANLGAYYKIMGATPDASIELTPGPPFSTTGGVVCVHVWRGVDQTTPMDVTPVTAQVSNTPLVDPPAITPVTSGAVVVAIGGAYSASDTFTSSDLENFLSAVSSAANQNSAAAIGSLPWTGGTVDPVVWAGMSDSTSYSYCAVSLALRPA